MNTPPRSKHPRIPCSTPHRFRSERILATSIAALLGFAGSAMAQTPGMFSSTGALGTSDMSASVGLSASKTYLEAIDLGDTTTTTVNGVVFTGSGTAVAPTGTGWAVTGSTTIYAGGGTLPGGTLGTLTNKFLYGGNPETLTVSGLTVGQTYVITLYNRSWEGAGNRVLNISASGASTGAITFDEDTGATAQGNLNLLRYTFQAGAASQTLTIAPQIVANTMHLYAFSTEQTFNNTWTGGNGGTNFSAASWSVAPPSGTGSNASFGAQASPTAITLDGDRTLGHVQFDGTNAWTLSGTNTLTLQTDVGGISVLSTLAGAHTISAPILLGSDAMKTGAGSLTLTGAISGSRALNVNGGTLTLTSANSYSGGTSVNAGATLKLGAAGALGLTSAPLTVNAGGFLNLGGTSQSVGNLSGTGGTIANDASGTAVTLSIGNANTGGGTFAGILADRTTGTGTLALTKTGTATSTLSGANTYSGATIISGGRLQLNGGAAAGTLTTRGISVGAGATLGFTTGLGTTLTLRTGSTLSLDGGTLALDLGSAAASDKIVADTLALTANSALAVVPVSGLSLGSTYTLATYNTLLNPGAFSISGTTAGRLTLTPILGVNAITMTPTLDSSTWNSATGGAWGAGPWTTYTPTAQGDSAVFGPALTASATVTVDSARSVGYLTFNHAAASYTLNTGGLLSLNNGTSTGLIMVNAGTHTITGSLPLASDVSITTDAGTALTINGVISGARALTKFGTGTLVLTAANTFSAGTTITEGTLQLGDGISPGSVVGNIADNATLAINNSTALTYSGAISGTGALTKTGTGTLTLTGANTFTGALTISAGSVDVGGGLTTGAIAGPVTNNGTLRFSRTGAVVLSNVINGTGTTILTGGASQTLSATAAINTPNVSVGDALQGYVFFGAPNQLNGTTGVVLNIATHASNSRILLNGFDQTVAGLTGTGIVQNSENVATTPAATFTLNVPGTNSYSWSGLIRTQAGGNLSVVKNGTGEQTMIFAVSNGAGSYVGATTINQGRLTFGSTYAAPIWATSGISVAAGAELGLTGAGAGVLSWATNGRIISGAGGVTRLGSDANTVTMNTGANSYTGPTTLSGTGILSIATLANAGTNSSIGAGINTSAATNAASLLFDGGTLLYTGGAIATNRLFSVTQNGGTLDSSGSGAINFNNPGALAINGTGARMLTLTGSNTGANTLAAAIGNGAGGSTFFTKSGAGTWVLAGAATYSGTTAINSGRLQLEGAAATASASSNVNINAGATLGFGAGAANTLALSGGLTLAGGTVAFDLGSAAGSDRITASSLTLTANSSISFNQISGYDVGTPYTLMSYTTLNNPGTYTLSGFQAGRLTLTPVLGATALTLTPVLDNAVWNKSTGASWSTGPWTGYTPTVAGDAALFGTVLTASATVTIDTPQSVGYLTFNNGPASYTLGTDGSSNLTLENSGGAGAQIVVSAGNHIIAETVNLNSDASLFTAAGTSLSVNGGFNGAAKSLTKNGAGTLTLSGFGNFATIAGTGLNLNQGTVRLGSPNALSASTGITMAAGAKLDLNGNDIALGFLSGAGGTVTDESTVAGLTTLNLNQATSTVFNGSLNDGATRSIAVLKNGIGGLTLGGTNTFSGGLTITSGNVIAASGSGPAIAGNVTLGNFGGGGAVWLIAGAATQQFGANSVLTFSNGTLDAKLGLRGSNQTVAGLDSSNFNSLSIIQNDELTAPGYTGAPGPATLTINTATDHSFYGLIREQVGGPLSLIKNGPGTQEFINRPDVVGLNYTGSTIINAGKLSLNLSGTTGNLFASNITVNAGGTLALDGTWTLSRTVSGAGDLIKQGFGTVTVSGADSHTGNTTIAAGTLAISGSISASASFDVQAGATLNTSSMVGGFILGATQTLKGDGSLLGATLINGKLAPGSNGIGTLFTESLTFGTGSTLALELNTTDLTSDMATINGALNIGTGVALTLTDLGANARLALGTQFSIATYAGPWNGGLFTFGGKTIADEGFLSLGVNAFRLDYDNGGNSVILFVVPEPTSAVSLLTGAACLLGLRRRRRCA